MNPHELVSVDDVQHLFDVACLLEAYSSPHCFIAIFKHQPFKLSVYDQKSVK